MSRGVSGPQLTQRCRCQPFFVDTALWRDRDNLVPDHRAGNSTSVRVTEGRGGVSTSVQLLGERARSHTPVVFTDAEGKWPHRFGRLFKR